MQNDQWGLRILRWLYEWIWIFSVDIMAFSDSFLEKVSFILNSLWVWMVSWSKSIFHSISHCWRISYKFNCWISSPLKYSYAQIMLSEKKEIISGLKKKNFASFHLSSFSFCTHMHIAFSLIDSYCFKNYLNFHAHKDKYKKIFVRKADLYILAILL